jgi:uncharacterized membrane protein YbhN (UPF0104 family)
VTADAGGNRRPAFLRASLSLAIALAFLAFAEWYIGWSSLLRPWREVPLGALVSAASLLILTHGMRALRVHDYFVGTSVQGQRLGCLRLVLQHNLFNTLLPMRAGELAFPVLISRRFGVGPSASLPGLLWFRVFDLHALLLIAMPLLVWRLPWPLVFALMLAWLPVPWLAWRSALRTIAIPAPEAGYIRRFLHRLLEGSPQTGAVFWRTQAWTLLNWSLKLALFAWVLLQFAPLSAGTAVLGALGGELTSVLPIHGAGGFGTYEAGIVALTLPSGADPAVLLRAAINLHLFVLGVTLVTGGLAFLSRPRRAQSEGSDR